MKAAVDALVAGAPDALDTLIELANALNNDPNFATTMATELGKKLNISDIVNNLTSGGTNKVLSAEQGKALKAALDSHNHDSRYELIITKLTAFNKNFGTTAGTVCEGNDSRLSNARPPLAHTHKVSEISDFPTSMPASDVPAWAKAASKPSYTASEVGASPSNHNHAGVYQPAGSYAASSHKHGATDITPDSTHRFVTDTEKRPGTVRLRETIIMILRINQKGIMQLYHISIRHLTSRMILYIDLSQIRKKMLGIVKRQEITTTIQYTNLRVVMLQVLINIQRRTLKKIRLIVL